MSKTAKTGPGPKSVGNLMALPAPVKKTAKPVPTAPEPVQTPAPAAELAALPSPKKKTATAPGVCLTATIHHDGERFTGTLTPDGKGVTVKKGTPAAEITSTSPEIEGTRRLRAKLIAEGVLAALPDDDLVVFTTNHEFKSKTAAARIICGTVVDGRAKWKV